MKTALHSTFALLLLAGLAGAQMVPARWDRSLGWVDPALNLPGSTLGIPLRTGR